jgi:hypothetical protein
MAITAGKTTRRNHCRATSGGIAGFATTSCGAIALQRASSAFLRNAYK